MSNSDGGKAPRSLGPAIFVGLFWAALMGTLFYLRPSDGEEASQLWLFLGRFHALIVHLPIGLVLAVPILELVGSAKGKEAIRNAVPTVLWLVVLSAIAATAFGYLLMTGEPDDSLLMQRHLWSGLTFGACAVVTLLLRLRTRGFAYVGFLGLSLASVSMAGHLGGALVHGSGYLTKYAPEALKPMLAMGLGTSSSSEGDAALEEGGEGESAVAAVPVGEQPVFANFVMPIMEAKCTECHNADKTKGKLRLDTYELIMAGSEGADYPNVEPGDLDASELIYRMTLPSDDDDFMPPDGKEPLSDDELAVVSWWVKSGASQDATVAELAADEAMMTRLQALSAALTGDEDAVVDGASTDEVESQWETLTDEERQARLDEVMAAADHFNFSVMPISAEDDRLKVNVVNAAKEFGDDQLATLAPVAEQILWLDVGRSQISDEGLKTIGQMANLERLHLENTGVTDEGIAHLGGLTRLEYLNLYGTGVTDSIFDTLANSRDLRKLYLWQTQVDPAEARAFQRSMSLEVNIGTDFDAVSSPDEEAGVAEEEEKPVEEPKKAETKKEEPSPRKPDAKPAAAANQPPAKAQPKKEADPAKAAPPEEPKQKPSEKPPAAKPSPDKKPVAADEKKPAA